jgi:hypothetical protein
MMLVVGWGGVRRNEEERVFYKQLLFSMRL